MLHGILMILVHLYQCLLLQVDHLREFHQLQFVVVNLFTDLMVLPSNLERKNNYNRLSLF